MDAPWRSLVSVLVRVSTAVEAGHLGRWGGGVTWPPCCRLLQLCVCYACIDKQYAEPQSAGLKYLRSAGLKYLRSAGAWACWLAYAWPDGVA
jgi:hypothetical protein